MQIRQYKDGSAEIIFTEQEKKVIMEKGIIKFTPEGLRHFGNNLVKIVSDFYNNMDEETKNKLTHSGDIETS